MTSKDYRTALAKLGLTQERAGQLLGYSLRTSQDYAIGTTPVPAPVAKLLHFLLTGRRVTIKSLEDLL